MELLFSPKRRLFGILGRTPVSKHCNNQIMNNSAKAVTLKQCFNQDHLNQRCLILFGTVKIWVQVFIPSKQKLRLSLEKAKLN